MGSFKRRFIECSSNKKFSSFCDHHSIQIGNILSRTHPRRKLYHRLKMASMKTLSVLFSALVVALLTILSHPVQSSPVPGWLCAVGTPAAYDRFCNAGRRLTEVELGVINRVLGTDKRIVGDTIK